MADALAIVDDVADAFGRDLTSEESAKAPSILLKASELFRRRSGQEFTAGRSTVRLKVDGERVYLPQRPVVEVFSVTDDDGAPVEFTQRGQWLTICLPSHMFVTVDYSHGGAVPDLVRLTIAEVAKRVLSIPDDAQQGVVNQSSTQGPFTEARTYATWAQGGQTMLAPDDLAIADSFRVRIPRLMVMRP